MKHFLLFYDYVADFREKRAPFRAGHLAHAQAAVERGELLLAGALVDEPTGGVLLFQAEAPGVVEAFAKADPYVTGGIATGWRVREWTTVVGPGALTKL